MINKLFKKGIIFFLILTITVFSVNAVVFAEEKEEKNYAENVEKLINNLTLLSRYETVTQQSLYKAAFEAIFENNPEMYETVMKALLGSIDEHSAYFNPEEAKAFMMDLNDEVTGIGVNVFESDGNILVSEPVPGSPAERVGIKAGDIIIGADDFDLRTMEFELAIDKIRGKEGTDVRVTVLRSGISEPLSFVIKREKVVLNPLNFEIIEHENKKIGKIKIYSFSNNVAKKFAEALADLDSKGIKNLIIDVRDNGGGYLDQTVEIADLLLPKDAIILTEDHKISILNKEYKATGKGKEYKIVVLVNGMSASASEVLTAALTENGVAKAVGQKTFGKGTVQSLKMAENGGILKYTTAYYLTPEGNNINKAGITPDVVIENSSKPVDMSEFDMFSLSKTYRIGDKGKEVELAKKMLKFMGIFVGELNDIYDENLKIAITTFQKLAGLFPYGVLDLTTQLNMYDKLKTTTVEVDDQLNRAIDMF